MSQPSTDAQDAERRRITLRCRRITLRWETGGATAVLGDLDVLLQAALGDEEFAKAADRAIKRGE